MPKTANIPTARMEICLDELLRTFHLEIDNMKTCFGSYLTSRHTGRDQEKVSK